MTTFMIVQVGYGVFGIGQTPEAAADDARQWLDHEDRAGFTVEGMPRYAGTAMTSAACDPYDESRPRKRMTDQGEMHTGQMVIMTADEAVDMGYELP